MNKISKKHMGEWKPEDRSSIDETYDLAKLDGKTFAKAHIYWDNNINSLRYEVLEPKLDSKMSDILKKRCTIMPAHREKRQ